MHIIETLGFLEHVIVCLQGPSSGTTFMMTATYTCITLDTTLLVVRAELVEQVQCGQETLQCATVSN